MTKANTNKAGLPVDSQAREPTHSAFQLTWRIAGVWMVLLAVGLGVIGVVLAIQQTRSFTLRLMTQARAQAGHFAETAKFRFEQELIDTLRHVAGSVMDEGETAWRPPQGLPSWVDGLIVSVGDRTVPLTTTPLPWRQAAERKFADLDHLELSRQRRPVFFSETVDGEPVVIAAMTFSDPLTFSVTVATRVDLHRLKQDFLDPLVSPYDGLEVVAAGESGKPWSQPLPGIMRRWSIEPTEAFIDEQRSAVLSQTIVYVALSVLALVVLLVALRLVMRVMRREMALAQMKADFVADVSHELKTPLALIRMFGETLQSGRVTSEEKRQEYYEIITRESSRLTNLINNILDFSRIDALKKSYVLERTDIGEVVRDTYDAYCAQLEHCGFEHHLCVAKSLPVVLADRDAITRAMINLINNAIKYSHDERYLAIDVSTDTRRGRRGVLISVHDRGIGIKPEDRARLFEGFFRAADARVREQSGTGLGLGLVKHIVDGHHGSIAVESRLVKGSTFRIFLPGVDGQSARETATGPHESRTEPTT